METIGRPRGGTHAVLAVLFLGAFAMGSAELLVMGMLDLIAADLAVSIPAAGALVTAFALGMAFGGPLLALVTAHLDRRAVLVGALAAFALLNLVPVLVADHTLFLVARAGVGATEGLFVAAALTALEGIVPRERAGRAMGVVITGFAAASALGMPLASLMGREFGWRASFVGLAVIGVGVMLAAMLVLPPVPTASASRTAGAQLRHAFAPRVLALLALCCLVFAGIQSALTYLVPYLGDVTGVTGPVVVGVLFAFGVATTVGSAAGSRFADAHAALALQCGTIGLTVSLLAMFLFGGQVVVAVLGIIGMGLFAMGMAPAMQSRVMSLAGPGAALAASLPASASNAGDAVGALLGGAAIGHAGLAAAVFVGAVIAATAVVVAIATGRLRPQAPATEAARRTAEPGAEPLAMVSQSD
ncbi:MFS transporter [Promicromonospora panici]|uniref:MFS transporter n=1 Tax=Promicromonospora panici TaxID=2219658 RepID=UPI00101CF6FC|nr:MFS transporter [Promicromonospora panici]